MRLLRLLENDWQFINHLLLKMYSSEARNLFDQDLMRNLSYIIPYDRASFFLHDHEGKNLLHKPLGIRFTEKELENYSPRFTKEIPHTWVNFCDKSLVIRDSDIDSVYENPRQQYYTNLLLSHNVKYALTLSLAHFGVRVGVLTLFREKDKEDFSDKEVYIAEQIIDHIACYAYSIYDLKKYQTHQTQTAPSITELSSRYSLSEREQDVLRLVAGGSTAKDISENLCIAETTVKKHLSSIYSKMGIKGKAELLRIVSPHIQKE